MLCIQLSRRKIVLKDLRLYNINIEVEITARAQLTSSAYSPLSHTKETRSAIMTNVAKL